jgi:protein SCO1/2
VTFPDEIHTRRLRRAGRLLVALSFAGTLAYAQLVKADDPQLSGIGVAEHLGEIIPLDAAFTNAAGEPVTLGEYFQTGKPVVLVLAYYECPMLCNLVLNGLSRGIRDLSWQLGTEYRVVTISIDPTETVDLAAAKKATYLAALPAASPENGWDFLIGDSANIAQITEALGFEYHYVPERDEFAHPSVVFLLTPEGKISRYLYGIEYRPRDLKLGLLEASEGKIGNTLDRIILYCYHYDPAAGSYVMFAANVMRLGGAVTVLVMAIFFGILWSREKHRRKSLTVE